MLQHNKPWKHFAMWKKSVTKDCILHNSIYMNSPELANLLTHKKKDQWVHRAERQGYREWQVKDMEFLFEIKPLNCTIYIDELYINYISQ